MKTADLRCPREFRPCNGKVMDAGPEGETDLPILYQDDRYVAVHKPAGMLVHRSPMDRGETVFCLQLLRDQLGRTVYPCHRLDKPTSGLLLFALDPEALQEANRLWQENRVHKHYLALVRGWLEGEGLVDHPLRIILDSGKPGRERQEARTRYRCLHRYEVPMPVGPYPSARYSLMELSPETGRTHQLRRHMKHLSHQVIGDTRYGDGRHNAFFREKYAFHRLFLASVSLEFNHPFSGKRLLLSCPPDPELTRVLGLLPLTA